MISWYEFWHPLWDTLQVCAELWNNADWCTQFYIFTQWSIFDKLLLFLLQSFLFVFMISPLWTEKKTFWGLCVIVAETDCLNDCIDNRNACILRLMDLMYNKFWSTITMLTTERAETTSREHNVIAALGSIVTFNCTLDVKCLNRSIRWKQFLPSSNVPILWYNGRRLRPTLASSGVSVEDSPTHGWSVLTIPAVTFKDYGSYQCFVDGGLEECRMNFQLSVSGKHCYISQHWSANRPHLVANRKLVPLYKG